MEPTFRFSISEARARLPELAQLVMESPEKRIIIEHRDRKERVVLVAESHLARLETMVEHFKQQTAGGSFTLAGSISSDLSDEELDAALAALREEAAAAAATKLLRIVEE